ncbi:MAG: NAD(+) synthase [Oscillospiraceae bacterium]|nr:NAD(+) synthase [Oscillospiraceae bacterium]
MRGVYNFNAAGETINVINWIKNWFENESGNASGVIIGISGGADSSITAKLCCDAIGADKVRGVLMPNKHQSDISDSYKICNILEIKYSEINIGEAFDGVINATPEALNAESLINLAPRLRMAAIYALGHTLNYRVAGAGNLSEKYVGYCTKWGIDMATDFNPIANFTKTEVKQIGDCLNLPREIVHKTPADGLSGLSDEENMKITYAVLDNYIRTQSYEEKDKEMIDRIIKRHNTAQHKLNPVPCYKIK